MMRTEPAVSAFVANVVVALVAAWGFHPNANTMGVIMTISTAVVTVLTAFVTNGVTALPQSPLAAKGVALGKGGALAATLAYAGIHLGLPVGVQAIAAAVASILVGLNLRAHLTPIPAVVAR